jgi:hypothetical protein
MVQQWLNNDLLTPTRTELFYITLEFYILKSLTIFNAGI